MEGEGRGTGQFWEPALLSVLYVVREWWRDEEMMETLTSQSSKAEDGVLPKQAL